MSSGNTEETDYDNLENVEHEIEKFQIISTPSCHSIIDNQETAQFSDDNNDVSP